jgi:hypothetical protein
MAINNRQERVDAECQRVAVMTTGADLECQLLAPAAVGPVHLAPFLGEIRTAMERATTQTPVHMTRLTAVIVAVIRMATTYVITPMHARTIARTPAARPTAATLTTMVPAIIQTPVHPTRLTAA